MEYIYSHLNNFRKYKFGYSLKLLKMGETNNA